MMTRSRSHHLSRYAAIALFAVLAGQVAVAGHAAVAEHGIGQHCDICVSADRLGHGLSELPPDVVNPPMRVPSRRPVALAAPVVVHGGPHARGPPIL
ncbi:MAG: hypothetical protein P8172_16615 [Gammaproteobacteria bacterium]